MAGRRADVDKWIRSRARGGAILPPRWRCWPSRVSLTALVGLGVLSWKLAGTSGPTWFDASVQSWLAHRFDHDHSLFRIIACLGTPAAVLAASVSLALLCGAIRAGRAALLCFFGPPLAGALAEWLLKPLIGRRFDGDLAFPSGHTTGAASVAVLLTVLFLPSSARGFRIAWPARAAFWLAAIAYGAGVGMALIILQAHYATDILGGIAVAVAVILTLARLLDFRAQREKTESSGLRSWAGYGSHGGSLGRRPARLGRRRSQPGPVQQGTADSRHSRRRRLAGDQHARHDSAPTVTPLPLGQAARTLSANTSMAGELRRYWPFAAMLALGTWTDPHHPPIAAIADALTIQPSAYELVFGSALSPDLAELRERSPAVYP